MEDQNEGRQPASRGMNLQHPKPLESPTQWQVWRQKFQRYRLGSGLQSRSQQEQVSILLYSMGDLADDIIKSQDIDENDPTLTYDTLITKLNQYFDDHKNVIVDRAKFNRRIQKPGESVDTFINDLHKLANECNYGALKDELIRDRIVVGVLDDALSNDLQGKADLTLAQAKTLARQAEARKENHGILRGESSVNQVSYKSRNSDSHGGFRSKSTSQKSCGYCGNECHPRDRCPAKHATCDSCSKLGHYQAVCRSKSKKSDGQSRSKFKSRKSSKIHQVSDTESDSDSDLLGQVYNVNDSNMWTANVKVNDTEVEFKLDTGASVSVLAEGIVKSRKLKHTDKVLHGPGRTKLTVLGSITANLQFKDRTMTDELYVIKGQKASLLGRSACNQLGLVYYAAADVHSISPTSCNFDPRAEYPRLFQGLGNMKKPYTIQIDSSVKPTRIYAPRKIPHPLVPKVKEEIERMLEQQVISPITEPTQWCSGIVVVPKPNGNVRICVDLTNLNKAVKREIHPMASVDESLAKLAGSKIFSKLDAKSGFHQIPLSEESRPYTCFVTPFGRYVFNRLPFEISSASDIFQRQMSEILLDLPGVIWTTF